MDDQLRSLRRELAATSDPGIAKQIIREAVRRGRWLVSKHEQDNRNGWATADAWNTNQQRVGVLRFLAYLGWKEAEALLKLLPTHTAGEDSPYPIRSLHYGGDPLTAFSEIGDKVAKTIDKTVLAAAAASACMAVAHLIPNFDPKQVLDAYANVVIARAEYMAAQRAVPAWGVQTAADQLTINQKKEAESAARSVMYRVQRPILDHTPRSRPVSPALYAQASAGAAWVALLNSSSRHESDQPEVLARVLFWATYAFAWECEPLITLPEYRSPEWEALGESHWARAPRSRTDWGDRYGARASVKCMREAKRKLRAAALDPSFVAAALLA